MSAQSFFRPGEEPRSPVAERVVSDPALVYEVTDDQLVVAVRSEVLVHAGAHKAPDVQTALQKIATQVGTLAGPDGGEVRSRLSEWRDRQAESSATGGTASAGIDPAEVEVWRLDDPERNSIDVTRQLRRVAGTVKLTTHKGSQLELPAVSPNHAAMVSGGKNGGCPAGPPHPSPALTGDRPFIEPCPAGEPGARVVVLDTGYIEASPPHRRLDERVTSELGLWFDTRPPGPPEWKLNPPDSIATDASGRLFEIVGHGTFIAGLIAHICPDAHITVVSHREQEVPVTTATPGLWASEVSLAHSLLQYAQADVIQCGFAYPTLDHAPSLPFAAAMHVLAGPHSPHPGIAVVSPAGNEADTRPYWPAAHPDVVGVAATNRRCRHRAYFSNWGPWVDCCTRGEDVHSTYIDFTGPVEGEPHTETFTGWARWMGTSFAAPKVSAAIARLVAADHDLTPVEAWRRLIGGQTAVQVTPVTDVELWPYPGLTLPQLHLG